jgi:hypothetical protein
MSKKRTGAAAMVASRLFSFQLLSSPQQPGGRKGSPSAQLQSVYKPFLRFANSSRYAMIDHTFRFA